MKLGAKLLLSYSAIALLVFGVGFGSFLLNEHVKKDLLQENEEGIRELHLISDLESQLLNSLIFTRNTLVEKKRRDELRPDQFHLLHRNSEAAVRESLAHLSQRFSRFQLQEPHLYERYRTPEITALEDTLAGAFRIYHSLLEELLELDQEELELADEMLDLTVEPYFRSTLLPLLDRYRTLRENQVDENLIHFEDRVGANTRWIIGLTSIALLLASVLSLWMIRYMIHPLRTLTEAADRIGSGNLSNRINIETGDELEQLGSSFNRMAENLNRTMVTKEYVNNIIQSMGDMLLVTTPDLKMELVNRRLTGILGYKEEDLIGESLSMLFDKEAYDSVQAVLARRTPGHLEIRMKRKDDTFVPVNLNESELLESARPSKKRVFVFSDITTLKEAEMKVHESLKEKEVLLAEIHHRVKNNLAVISGLLEMQVWSLSQEDSANIDALKESQLRIQSIALVHELLYHSESFSRIDLSQYIDKLLLAIQKTHRRSGREVELELDLEDLQLTINQAIPVSLILNELVVNAYKHAFSERDKGKVTIQLHWEGDEAILVVEDNGVGLPEPFNPMTNKSLGMTLVRTLARQIHAKLDVGNRRSGSTGARFSLRFHPESTT
ncbi:MAG: histidine kinase dimerization/phosphoacceptor domain -containing protein [Balneolaceae bacterium]